MTLNRALWQRLWTRFSSQPRADHWFEEIKRRYNEPHRHYHNAQHINECLREFESIKNTATSALALELGIWLHDVIYDPQRADNEDQSKTFASELLADGGADRALTDRVTTLIDFTKHNRLPVDELTQFMIDLDLAILGQPSERFWQYEQQIRAEYHFVPEQIFRSKRAEILERYLARSRIYFTDPFHDKYEQQARVNLRSSITHLRDG